MSVENFEVVLHILIHYDLYLIMADIKLVFILLLFIPFLFHQHVQTIILLSIRSYVKSLINDLFFMKIFKILQLRSLHGTSSEILNCD